MSTSNQLSTSSQSVTTTNYPIVESQNNVKPSSNESMLKQLPTDLYRKILDFLDVRGHTTARLLAVQFKQLFPQNAYLGPIKSQAEWFIGMNYRGLKDTCLQKYKDNFSNICSVGAPLDIRDITMELIAPFPSLKILEVFNSHETGFSNKELQSLASSHRNLEYLSLSWTEVDDDGLQHLKEMPLKTLFIYNYKTTLTDKAILHLSNISSLTSLTVHLNTFTIEGLRPLTQLPLKNLSIGLNNTRLGANQITDNEIEEIRKMMPCLETLYVRTKLFE